MILWLNKTTEEQIKTCLMVWIFSPYKNNENMFWYICCVCVSTLVNSPRVSVADLDLSQTVAGAVPLATEAEEKVPSRYIVSLS